MTTDTTDTAPALDVEGLRRVAEAAMPGDWPYCGQSKGYVCSCGYVFGDNGTAYIFKALDLDDEVDPVANAETRAANVRFVSAWKPATALALLDELERARAALDRIEPNIGWRGTPPDDLESDLYHCEFCAGSAALDTDIPHHDECPIHEIRAVLAGKEPPHED